MAKLSLALCLIAAFVALTEGSGCYNETVTVCNDVQQVVCPTTTPPPDIPIKFMAWNIKTFGVTKMSKPDVVANLVATMVQWDLVMIQEIRDASGAAIADLQTALNAAAGGATYGLVIGARQGRSSYKEQVAFLFRTDKLFVIRTSDWADPGDKLERDPFVVEFGLVQTTASVSTFVVIGLHLKPSDVPAEMVAVEWTYQDVASLWSTDRIIVAGDLNADCSYFTTSEKSASGYYNDASVDWLIAETADTTVSTTTNCAYDRFVLSGPTAGWREHVHQPAVVLFDVDLGLTETQAKDVSDHYPVGLRLM